MDSSPGKDPRQAWVPTRCGQDGTNLIRRTPHLLLSITRRPSLASIFRIGQKNKGTSTASTGESSQDSYSENRSASRGSNMSADDDWDRIDSAVDLDAAIRLLGDGTATIKGKNGCPPPGGPSPRSAAQARPSCRSESRRRPPARSGPCGRRACQTSKRSSTTACCRPDRSRGRAGGQRRARTPAVAEPAAARGRCVGRQVGPCAVCTAPAGVRRGWPGARHQALDDAREYQTAAGKCQGGCMCA